MSDFQLGSDGSDYDDSGDDQASDSLANPFLAKIPEEDRGVVEKYIKDWDAGVTQRFQKIHDEYRPYKDLGADPEVLQQAYALQQMIDDDPARVYQLLGEIVNGEQDQGQQGQQYQQSFQDELPPAFIEKFTQMEQALNALAGHFMQNQEATQAQQEDAQLDDYLADLHERYGDFDEDWVLSKMLKGTDGDAAVKQFNEFVQSTINSRMSGKRPVPVLGGGGALPANGVDPSKLSRTQTQDLVARMLEDAAGQQ